MRSWRESARLRGAFSVAGRAALGSGAAGAGATLGVAGAAEDAEDAVDFFFSFASSASTNSHGDPASLCITNSRLARSGMETMAFARPCTGSDEASPALTLTMSPPWSENGADRRQAQGWSVAEDGSSHAEYTSPQVSPGFALSPPCLPSLTCSIGWDMGTDEWHATWPQATMTLRQKARSRSSVPQFTEKFLSPTEKLT
mmetsp:Transcript_22851/g.66510  ORF Transcript_22851/g.66510 Transcript_22851/m.66510 type:complete len:200 (-) Transcript_22851:327-926(-)